MTVRQILPPGRLSNESGTGLVILPILATGTFYLLPAVWQAQRPWQFVPQAMSYACLGLWALQNTQVLEKLGLEFRKIKSGVWKGLWVGVILGSVNTALILFGAPALGIDIGFLRETPHAQIPPAIMVPWFILLIALAVEINFRGFVLGRVEAFCSATRSSLFHKPFVGQTLALGISSLLFAFDPFLVATFQSLHWIAVWDGLIWGWIWLYTRNLYIPIAAHTMEVIIEFTTIRSVLI